jgi:ACS family tartrate transporter-like MFS transporter
MTVKEALLHPRVLLLAVAYFLAITPSYGTEFFLPSVLQSWYGMTSDTITSLVIVPPILALATQLFCGWSSDRRRERRYHAAVPVVIGGLALVLTPLTRSSLALTMTLFVIAWAGFKAYLPAFWALPSTFLTEAAAAGSIGLINSLGNLGGYLGPKMLGKIAKDTGSFTGGLFFIGGSMLAASLVIFFIGGSRRAGARVVADAPARANSSAGTS